MRIEELKIDEEFQKLIPPLSEDEYRYLKESIEQEGIREPVAVWNGTVIDGHNRVKICKELGITEVNIYEKDFKNRNEAEMWMFRNQIGRRNLTDVDRVRLVKRFEKAIEAEMKKRQRESGGDKVSAKAKASGSDQMNRTAQSEHKTARKIKSEMAGVSEGKYQRIDLVLKEGTPEQIERLEKGGTGNSASAIAEEIRAAKRPPRLSRPGGYLLFC